MPRNPPWSREELLLALDLYLRAGMLDGDDARVIALSQLLGQLAAGQPQPDPTRFRNVNGVRMKLANFAALDGQYAGASLTHGGRRDAAIWDEFHNTPERLAAEVAAIHQRLAAGVVSAPARALQYWALAADPRTYDVAAALANLSEDSWRSYRSTPQVGDRVVIWQTQGGQRGKPRGVVALGEVLEGPAARPDASPFWVGAPPAGLETMPRIRLRYVKVPHPLWWTGEPGDPLADLTVNGTQGGIFKVTPLQWQRVLEALGGWPEGASPAEDIAGAEAALAVVSGRQGFTSDTRVRRAIEERAMAVARTYLCTDGWSVLDVHLREPYDFLCTAPGRLPLHVEVKGTRTAGEVVLLTRGEVDHARAHYPNVALLIVTGIQLTRDAEGGPIASGGELQVYQPWQPEDDALSPLAFQYTVPSL